MYFLQGANGMPALAFIIKKGMKSVGTARRSGVLARLLLAEFQQFCRQLLYHRAQS